MDDMDDKTALEDMRNGGEAGFKILHRRYSPKLRGTVLWLLTTKYNTSKDRANIIADDICQETFLSFYQNIATFEEKCSVMTWLSNLARNRTIDYFQKEEKEQSPTWLKKIKAEDLQKEPVTHEKKSLEEETEETLFEMGMEAIEQEEKIFCLAECIGKALTKSDTQDADCLIALIFSLQKLSIEDIAKEIGKNPKETKAFLNRCKRKLKSRPNCLIALTLFYALELSQNELATILAKTTNAVGVFLLECRKKLKNDIHFKNCCQECGYQLEE